MESLKEQVKKLYKSNRFLRFDEFIISEMGVDIRTSDEWHECAREAHRRFIHRLRDTDIASAPTIRRWFGLDGWALPDRDKVFEIAFSLGLDETETKKWLMVGLKEPGYQINDYREIVYMYGLRHHMSMSECEDMLTEYEAAIEDDMPICHTHSTHEIGNQYMSHADDDRETFVSWMIENARYLKGYSMTTLDYLKKYKTLVWKSIREDAAILLDNVLEETEYATWERMRFIRHTTGKSIRTYIYKYAKLDDDIKKNILNLTKLAYAEGESNIALIREVFDYDLGSVGMHDKNDGYRGVRGRDRMPRMTEKRLSDLLGMAQLREKYIISSPDEKKAMNMMLMMRGADMRR